MLALLAALVVGLAIPAAEAKAASVPKVGGLAAAGQDWFNSKLKVRWKRVARARYQVRWAAAPAKLAKAKIYGTTATSATSPTLNRCVPAYVQVRAVRGRKAGAWSTTKKLLFTNTRPGPITMTGTGVPNGVKFSWPRTAYASRYRVVWNAAVSGKFPGPVTYVNSPTGTWMPQTATSTTLALPTVPEPGDKMMGVAYANPVFAKIQANNACKPTDIPSQQYIRVFPKAPDPGTGDAFSFGNYNVEASPTLPTASARIASIVANIDQRDLQVVALVEAHAQTATDIVDALNLLPGNTGWTAVASAGDPDQRILYRSDVFSLVSSGEFGGDAPGPGVPILTPWARFSQVAPSDPDKDQDLVVVAVHTTLDGADRAAQKKDAHDEAVALLGEINGEPAVVGVPLVLSGDLQGVREPYADDPLDQEHVEGQPTYIRNGFYDAMAAVQKVGIDYNTVNAHTGADQLVYPSSPRADYILLRGFNGSAYYENVTNWYVTDHVTPSDHNLVFARLVIPYSS
ncbi:hypothetical protein EFK50_15750 [Nocardioides marmoriginsengisoli]|uniref:Endonuclease/exonuclease/phosphatase domain-containing protein n=1 Tax=Nocardioides marmoriginsengisoli TaxID=661483 RepID=A0A3N0CI56_9ACTN|nr:hypothetical protein EFK50_15750 [Nocardioides marmoriginsengisoli]